MRTTLKGEIPYPFIFSSCAIFLLLAAGSFGTLSAQDFSENIRTSALACVQATVEGDYKTLERYTHPAVMEMLDNIAGGEGKGIEFIEQQMKSLEEEGAHIDSMIVGDPTPHVVAGKELMAVVPTVLYMSVQDMRVRQESYLIAISGDAGKTWTFVNGSDNVDMMIEMLFPNWNDELQLPVKKGPEILEMEGDEE